MISVMYHYVREGKRPPNYYYLDVTDFRRQLDYLEETYGFVSRESFLDVIQGNRETLPSGAILTFDDGFQDHYQYVFPELKERGLWGIFYVPGRPYKNDQVLDVHRIHLLLGSVSGTELLEQILDRVNEDMLPFKEVDSFRTAYREFDDTEATKRAKKILNMYMKEQAHGEVLDALFDQLNPETVPVDDYYLQPGNIREMHSEGMIFGAHTMTHPVLSKLDREDQKREIHGSFQVLEDIIGELGERTFCYPFGKKLSYDDTTIQILNEANCAWSFIVDPEDIRMKHIRTDPQELPRYDCNQFPHGDASGSIGV